VGGDGVGDHRGDAVTDFLFAVRRPELELHRRHVEAPRRAVVLRDEPTREPRLLRAIERPRVHEHAALPQLPTQALRPHHGPRSEPPHERLGRQAVARAAEHRARRGTLAVEVDHEAGAVALAHRRAGLGEEGVVVAVDALRCGVFEGLLRTPVGIHEAPVGPVHDHPRPGAEAVGEGRGDEARQLFRAPVTGHDEAPRPALEPHATPWGAAGDVTRAAVRRGDHDRQFAALQAQKLRRHCGVGCSRSEHRGIRSRASDLIPSPGARRCGGIGRRRAAAHTGSPRPQQAHHDPDAQPCVHVGMIPPAWSAPARGVRRGACTARGAGPPSRGRGGHRSRPATGSPAPGGAPCRDRCRNRTSRYPAPRCRSGN